MTTYYVGSGGNNANAGTSWALRKLTLNGAEDIPVAAGDTVYVGPGTYRETLTCDVSGTAGSPITYIGDYAGASTDGVGGVVRITGSDNDQTAARARCILAVSKNYRTFQGFLCDTTTAGVIFADGCTDWIVNQCFFQNPFSALFVQGAGQARFTTRNCQFYGMQSGGYGVHLAHSADVSDAAHVVESCQFVMSGGIAVLTDNVGGITVRNCHIMAAQGIRVLGALAAGQTVTVNNCNFVSCTDGCRGTAVTEIIENYNNFYAVSTPRTNTNTGANSVSYPPLFDTRWFFEMVNGGRMVTPLDLASYSQLVNLAGTSPTTADLRGTTVQGAQREWGSLEYDPTLLIEAGSGSGGGAVSISPYRGNF